MSLPLPPRDPQSPVNPRQLRTVAESVMELVSTIRDYLPVLGDTEAKSSNHTTLDRWYSYAGDAYTRIERLRNPQQLTWPGPRGSFSTEGPKGVAECYMEICYRLEPIVEHYGWQSISDGSRVPFSGVRQGDSIPPIDDSLLRAIEKPAKNLLELTEDVQAWDYDDEDPPKPETDEEEVDGSLVSANKTSDSEAAVRLLSVFTNRLTDERFKEAAIVLQNDGLTAHEKLTKIDKLMPFPPTASAEDLGQLVDVSKQAVLKTKWWIENRKGEKDNLIGRRHDKHHELAKQHESDRK